MKANSRLMKVLVAGLICAAPAIGFAQFPALELSTIDLTKEVTEAQILAATGKADYNAGGVAVSPTGTIYIADTQGTGGNAIVRVVPGSPATPQLMATNTDIINALEAVNGTATVTSVSIRQVGVLADGRIVATGFSNLASADWLIVLTDAAPAAITVIHTQVDGDLSEIDGIDDLAVSGNTVYITLNENNGIAGPNGDAIYEFDLSTAVGPRQSPTLLINKAGLEAVYGVANESTFNSIWATPDYVYGVVSVSTAAPDIIGRVPTSGPSRGVAEIVVDKATVVNALSALDPLTTDVGYGAITLDSNGVIYIANSFGNSPDSLYDDSLIQIDPSTIPATVTGIQKGDLAVALGINAPSTPFLANDGMFYDAARDRIYFAEGSQNPADAEGIWWFNGTATRAAASVSEWNSY